MIALGVLERKKLQQNDYADTKYVIKFPTINDRKSILL